MRINKKALVLCAVFAFSACVPVRAAMVDKVIVVVDEEVITQREFDRQFAPIKARFATQFKGEELRQKLDEARGGFLDSLISSKVAVSAAKRLNIEIDEDELQAKISKIKVYYGSEEDFLKALNSKGTNLTEFEKEMRDQILAQTLVEKEVGSKIVITPADIRELYEKNKEQMVSPKRAKVRSIMIRKTGDEANDKKRLSEVRKKVNKNNFAETAKKFSEGPYTSKGGDMGYIASGQTVKEIDEVIFSIKQGDISEPIETRIGYHIIMVEGMEDPKQLELAEVSEFLRERLYMKRFQEQLAKWLEEKKKDAYISYK